MHALNDLYTTFTNAHMHTHTHIHNHFIGHFPDKVKLASSALLFQTVIPNLHILLEQAKTLIQKITFDVNKCSFIIYWFQCTMLLWRR